MSEEKPTITIHELPTSLLAAASLTPLSVPPGMEPPTGLCEHCGERDASCWWVGDGGVLAMIRGWARAWCELCVVEAQLEDAEKQAARLPELRKRRAELRDEPTTPERSDET